MSRIRHREEDYFVCANCGARLPADAHFCRACGASAGSGWPSEDDDGDQDDPEWQDEAGDEDEDYQEFLSREFPQHAEPDTSTRWRRAVMVSVVLLLCLAFLLMGALGL